MTVRTGAAWLHQMACARNAKLSVENLKAVRSKTGLSISLCRQALLSNADSVPAALKWLDENEAARAEFAISPSCACECNSSMKCTAEASSSHHIRPLLLKQPNILL